MGTMLSQSEMTVHMYMTKLYAVPHASIGTGCKQSCDVQSKKVLSWSYEGDDVVLSKGPHRDLIRDLINPRLLSWSIAKHLLWGCAYILEFTHYPPNSVSAEHQENHS